MTRPLFVFVASLFFGHALAQQYELETVADDLDEPWCVAFLPNGDYLVTEMSGRLVRLDATGKSRASISGVPEVYRDSQGGLFDVALHPDFAANQTLYLSYAEGPARKNATTVARARLDGEQLADVKVIYSVSPRKDTPVHYGGRLLFLPDGTLLLTTGDGFDYREAAQDIKSGLGKVIRMNDDGTPAANNPLAKAPHVYSYGHRNPQGLAITQAGRVYLHEHGPRGGDELNLLEAGVNYGWPAITHGVDYSGALVSPFTEWKGMAQPLHHWTPSIAPSGLAVYEGADFPDWRGDLFVGALVHREVRRLDMKDGKFVGEEAVFPEIRARIRDIRISPADTIHILTDGSPGRLIRVVPAAGD
ncbi:MAG: PQQ-dependent sugar dehydrogenase [Gammaproteobacteria bacterium]|nr:PQQ-dependent sugar dehydrogenase [Gammaproteobacteria bacterium]